MEVAPLTTDRWRDFLDLFERRGPRGGQGMQSNGCWCMWWRERTADSARNKRALHSLVRKGREPGLLAYEDGVAVGWLSLGPREEFAQLTRSSKYGPEREEPAVWSIVCFYVHAAARHRGVADALLAAAVDHARARGAKTIEAYPHVRGDYMGSPELFERAGFRQVRAVEPRLVMRRRLTAGRKRPPARGRAAR
jgi:ribosomal protein S18 acetylase RimI-like enzyme